MDDRRLLVVDDDVEHGQAVVRLLNAEGHRAEMVSDPQQLISDYSPDQVSCILSDVRMPKMSGFELATALRTKDPAVAIIFMTGWPKAADAVDAIRQFEAIDYLSKPIDRDRLVQALNEALTWSANRREVEKRLTPLTPRERQVFDLLVQGHTNKSVAAELGLSPKTVEDHRAAVMSKTLSGNMTNLMRLSRALQGKAALAAMSHAN